MSAVSRRSDKEAMKIKTTIVIGANRSTSNGAGLLNPRRLARKFLTPSAIATAICPPSSGRSGSKLNIPTKRLSEAIINIKVATFSRTVKTSVLAVSPLTLATPTTPTKPCSSRFSPPKVCLTKSGILAGRVNNDVKLFFNISPVYLVALAVAVTGA